MKKRLAIPAIGVLATTLAAGGAIATAPPASAGTSVCLGIWPRSYGVYLQHLSGCGVSGTYHIEIWGGGRHDNGANYYYNGRLREFKANWPVPSGTKVCAQLWYHKPGGGYESKGLPCITK